MPGTSSQPGDDLKPTIAPMDDAQRRAYGQAAKLTCLAATRGMRDTWMTQTEANRSLFELSNMSQLMALNSRRDEMRWYQAIRDTRAEVLIHGQQGWPSRLRHPDEADPALLYIRGVFPADDYPTAAVIGSRRASPEALKAAHQIGEDLAGNDIVLVSGLAAGIDTAAHQGALAANGLNVAVIGTGIDVCFPPENADLCDQIAATGVVVSQFPPGQRGSKTSFPARNGVVASLADVVVVVAASATSGTRITMDKAASAAADRSTPVIIWEPTVGRPAWLTEWADCKHGYGNTVVFASSQDELVALVRET